MHITFDQYSKSLNRPSGPVTLDEAKEIIGDYIDGQKDKYESDQEPFAFSIFSFSRDKRNFVEISIDSKKEYRIRLQCRSERIPTVLSWAFIYNKEYHVASKDDLINLVSHFYRVPIKEYKEHFDSLPFKKSKPHF